MGLFHLQIIHILNWATRLKLVLYIRRGSGGFFFFSEWKKCTTPHLCVLSWLMCKFYYLGPKLKMCKTSYYKRDSRKIFMQIVRNSNTFISSFLEDRYFMLLQKQWLSSYASKNVIKSWFRQDLVMFSEKFRRNLLRINVDISEVFTKVGFWEHDNIMLYLFILLHTGYNNWGKPWGPGTTKDFHRWKL